MNDSVAVSGNESANDSGSDAQQEPMFLESALTLKLAHDILIVILLVAVMFAMGCHITWKQVWQHLRRPIGISIGMASQFVLLPLCAFCLILALGLDVNYATGMLVLACSPGGVTSNIFTYFCDGDVSLSVSMTSCSTLVALGMMPFNMWLYGHSLEMGQMIIPYQKIAISLAAVTTPVGAGMLLRWWKPKVASCITKIGSYSGFALIFICQTMELIIFPDIFKGTGWQFYIALFTLPALGLTLGYSLAALFRQAAPVRKTVAIECSIQNVGTALTVISLSFPIEIQRRVLAFPWLYSIPLMGTVSVSCLLYQIYKRTCAKNKEPSYHKAPNGVPPQSLIETDAAQETHSFITSDAIQDKLSSV